ncbi:MAG TPA: vWA domain-containing protein [Nannocystis sp.]
MRAATTFAFILATSACTPSGTDTDGKAGDASSTGGASSTSDVSSTDAPGPTTGGTATSAGTGGEMSGGTTFEPVPCDAAIIDIPIAAPNVVLVLDKSGSMVAENTGYWDHDGDDADNDGFQDADVMSPATPRTTLWSSLYGGVASMIASFDASLNLGMVLLPSMSAQSTYNEFACIVEATPEVPVAPMNGAAILAAMPGSDATYPTIGGATPTAKALATAIDELTAIRDDRPKFIVLVTDGAPSCSAGAANNTELFEVLDASVGPQIAEAFTVAGISTFVVGLAVKDATSPAKPDAVPDNVNLYTLLDEYAQLGGVPREGPTKFYDAQNEIELTAALEEIARRILSCTIDLGFTPDPRKEFSVAVNGVDYGPVEVAACDGSEHGWMFTDATRTKIALCGQACADFQTVGALEAHLDCPAAGSSG